MKNYLKKGSMFTLVLMLSCLIFTSCNKDMDDLSVAEPDTSESATSIYFYGSDAEFAELQGVEITPISTEEQLEHISKTAEDFYALFVGKEIDVREGLVNNLRNAGILVTQLEGNSAKKSSDLAPELTVQPVLPENEISDGNSASDVDESFDFNQLHFTTYLSVNGLHKMLGGTFESMEQAVPKILEWREKKLKENTEASSLKSTSGDITQKVALDIDFTWSGVMSIGLNTEVFLSKTPGYMLNDGSGDREYPDMLLYDHKLAVTPSSANNYSVNNIQTIQEPAVDDNVWFFNSLRGYSPLNSSNGVLSGRTGSDSWGYSVSASVGVGLDGPNYSNTVGADWSHSTDWSVPACQVNTYHNLSTEVFHAMYIVDPWGAWSTTTVSVENYAYYACSYFNMEPRHYDIRPMYFAQVYSTQYNHVKDVIFHLSHEKIHVWKYHSGYFNDPNNYDYMYYQW